jgi:hypothetical protein
MSPSGLLYDRYGRRKTNLGHDGADKPSLKTPAEKAAADDGRSLSSLIEKLLTDYLRAKGYLPK